MVSPKSPIAFLVLLLLVALLLPACLTDSRAAAPAAGQSGAVSPAAPGQVYPGTGISVLGQGSVSVAPDQAEVWLGVSAKAQSVSEAQNDASNRMAQIMDRLTALGVSKDKITTVRYNISPQYGQNQVLTGYQVDNVISVKTTAIDKLGTLLDSVVTAGANRVERISFGVANPTPLAAKAREAAMADARAKADQLAKLAGVSLGRPIILSESTSSAPPAPLGLGAAAAPAAQAVPISPGESEIRVTVQVTYSIE